jgi:hypothetical protein
VNARFRFAIALAALSAAASVAQAATCDRDCLGGFVTQYLNAMVAHSPSSLPLANNVRFTEDTAVMKVGASPLWRNISRVEPYRLDILDVKAGVAASLIVAEEATMPELMVLRLKIAGGKISEIETQVTRNKAEGSLFKPEALKTPSAAMLQFVGDAERNSREDLIRIAELYPAGLKSGSFVNVDVPFAKDAYRFENGNLMAGPGCTFMKGCEDIKGQHIPTLAGIQVRVAAVDEYLGIVLLRMDFGAGSTRVPGDALMVWEAFKIYGGQIHAVEAFMKNMPAGTPSGWDTAANN